MLPRLRSKSPGISATKLRLKLKCSQSKTPRSLSRVGTSLSRTPACTTEATQSRNENISRLSQVTTKLPSISCKSPCLTERSVMTSITNKKRSLILFEMKQEHISLQKVIQARRFKKRLAENQCRKYGINFARFSYSHLSELQIIEAVKELWRWRLASKAAKFWLAWFRARQLTRLKEGTRARQHIAALWIQLHWKKYKVSYTQTCTLWPKRRIELETQAALTIQRVYRGSR